MSYVMPIGAFWPKLLLDSFVALVVYRLITRGLMPMGPAWAGYPEMRT